MLGLTESNNLGIKFNIGPLTIYCMYPLCILSNDNFLDDFAAMEIPVYCIGVLS